MNLFDVEMEPDDAPAEPHGVEAPAVWASAAAAPEAPDPVPFVEVLPADFRLPLLVKFVPDTRLRAAVDTAASQLSQVAVTGAAGLARADELMGLTRASVAAVTEHFRDPKAVANALHKRLSGMESEWTAPAHQAMDVKSREIVAEQRRLQDMALEAKRAAQAEADERARQQARATAEAAAASRAPRGVVQELRKAAETISAPPVPDPEPLPAMANTAVVPKWRARLRGTAAEATVGGQPEAHPDVADLTDAQRLSVLLLLKGIVDGKVPIAAVKALDWGYLDRRASAEKTAFSVPGLEAYDEGGTRSKPAAGARRRK